MLYCGCAAAAVVAVLAVLAVVVCGIAEACGYNGNVRSG